MKQAVSTPPPVDKKRWNIWYEQKVTAGIKRWAVEAKQILGERIKRNLSFQIQSDFLRDLQKQLGVWGRVTSWFRGKHTYNPAQFMIDAWKQLIIETDVGLKELSKGERAEDDPISLSRLLYLFDFGFELVMDSLFIQKGEIYKSLSSGEILDGHPRLAAHKEKEARERKIYSQMYNELHRKRSALMDYLHETDFLKMYHPD